VIEGRADGEQSGVAAGRPQADRDGFLVLDVGVRRADRTVAVCTVSSASPAVSACRLSAPPVRPAGVTVSQGWSEAASQGIVSSLRELSTCTAAESRLRDGIS
jgi:hypothetical protein